MIIQIPSKKLFVQGKSLLIYFNTRKNELFVTVKDTSSDLVVFDKSFALNRNNLVLHAH